MTHDKVFKIFWSVLDHSTLRSNSEIFLKGLPAVEMLRNRRIF